MILADHPAATRGASPAARAGGAASLRSLFVAMATTLAFLAVGGQLIRLALKGQGEVSVAISEPIATTYARPDIVDRQGRLLATDIETHSLYADPAVVLDADEAVEKLATVFTDLDSEALRHQLSDRSRRFVWIRRGLSPAVAQRVHDLGVPGLGFRRELRRAYPAGGIAGHVIGSVDIDNKGQSAIERYIDDKVGVEQVASATPSDHPPVRLSLDVGVQHALEDELSSAMRRYRAAAAAGLILDVRTGEVLASASLPDIDPARPLASPEVDRVDRVSAGTYELGSILKTVTIAMALDNGQAGLDTMLDVAQPLEIGSHVVKDEHPLGRPLSVAEVFVHSSNVGAAMLALAAGTDRQREFLTRLGLTGRMDSERGMLGAPQLPERWDRAETITIAYGHGIALAPLQLAAAAAALVNGGTLVKPTFLRRLPGSEPRGERVVSARTSRMIREVMRRNVTDPAGTGRRAAVVGYDVGGKTGTAEMPGRGGYRRHAVIASFLGAFPMRDPRYVTLVSLFRPQPVAETKGRILAGLNAAPTTSRLITRVAPLLGMAPTGTE
jgi:cell division protein FtsI (penicillin-binding protein 3)